MTKHRPTTKPPFAVGTDLDGVIEISGDSCQVAVMTQAREYAEQDAAFLVHAGNAYGPMVERLTAVLKAKPGAEQVKAATAALGLLNEIGEGD